jgi:hypothetical protein
MAVLSTQEPTLVFASVSQSVLSTQELTLIFGSGQSVLTTQDVTFVFWETASVFETAPTKIGQLWPAPYTQTIITNEFNPVPLVQTWNADAVIEGIPSGTVEIDNRLRKTESTETFTQMRLYGNISRAAPSGTLFEVQPSNTGSTWSSIGLRMRADTTGEVSGSWVSIPSGSVPNAIFRVMTVGNGGSIAFSYLELQLRR